MELSEEIDLRREVRMKLNKFLEKMLILEEEDDEKTAEDVDVDDEAEDIAELTEEDVIAIENIHKAKKKEKRKSAKIFILGLLCGLLLAYVVVAGARIYSRARYIKALESAQKTEKTEEKKEHDSIVNSDTTVKMAYIEKLINNEYYKDVDYETLEDGVYSGMLDCLGDPYSVYYNEDELKDVLDSGEGIYYGIGAYISIDKDTDAPIIAGVMSGTPAEESGLQADDIIAKVDGVDTLSMTTNEVVKLIKGPEHTKVVISVIREGEKDYLDIEVERRKIESPTVEYEMKEDNIGYIQITEFDEVTTDQFTEALAVLKGQEMKGLILDLRSNGGGNLSTCIAIASQLLPKGLIVYTEDKYGNREEYTCDGKREIDIPMVVLVNGYSASASEILTGAIKDYKKGTIMGTTTFGKGIVQSIIPLRDGTAVKITTSSYFTPSGKNIHGVGIEPDIEVVFDGEAYNKDKSDNQLDAAIKEIQKELE